MTLYENEKRQPRREVWDKLAKEFEVETAYIMGLTEYKNSVGTQDNNWNTLFDETSVRSMEELLNRTADDPNLKKLLISLNTLLKNLSEKEIQKFQSFIFETNNFIIDTKPSYSYTPFNPKETDASTSVSNDDIQSIISKHDIVRLKANEFLDLQLKIKLASLYDDK